MKTLRSRVMLLGAALGLVLLLGSFLLRPDDKRAGSGKFPWAPAVGVVAVGVVAFFARRRATAGSREGVEHMTCVEKLRLQPGKVLHLVEVDGTRLLLSTSESGVQLVCELDRHCEAQQEESS